jgi:acetyl esterase/lipase
MSSTDSTQIDPAQDPAIDRRSRAFLRELNKDSSPFWELPGEQPREIVTELQGQTPVDLGGIEIDRRELTVDDRTIPLYVVRPEGATGTLPVFMFFHGAVWIAGNFENHKRLVRDLVVGSQAVAVFPEYTPVPEARYPVQMYRRPATRSRSSRPTRPPSGSPGTPRRSASTPPGWRSPATASAATWPPR